jgi:NAD dependent epimerase/dehydratase family enzyme
MMPLNKILHLKKKIKEAIKQFKSIKTLVEKLEYVEDKNNEFHRLINLANIKIENNNANYHKQQNNIMSINNILSSLNKRIALADNENQVCVNDIAMLAKAISDLYEMLTTNINSSSPDVNEVKPVDDLFSEEEERLLTEEDRNFKKKKVYH